jgi:hypothetical protein
MRFSVCRLSRAIRRSIAPLAAAALLCPQTAAAQSTSGNLTGKVVDETFAVVPDVKITVMSVTTGFERHATTDSNGQFALIQLPAGLYVLTAEMPGFRTITVDDIEVRAGFSTEQTIELVPVGISESLNVHARMGAGTDANHIDITSATLRYSVDSRQIGTLPVWSTALGRNSLGVFPFLVPGVSPITPGGTADASVNRLGSQMAINGARSTSVSFNLDGGDNNDYELNRAAAPMPNPDAIQEFSIATNAYQADQGRGSGGIVDATIRSGTSQYHGGLRYFLINEALNSRGFFDPRTPLDKLHTYGFQLSGPMRPSRVFGGGGRTLLFADFEGTRYGFETTEAQNVPAAGERSGDFGSVPIFDPVNRVPFPGNKIPAAQRAARPSDLGTRQRERNLVFGGHSSGSRPVDFPTRIDRDIRFLERNLRVARDSHLFQQLCQSVHRRDQYAQLDASGVCSRGKWASSQ